MSDERGEAGLAAEAPYLKEEYRHLDEHLRGLTPDTNDWWAFMDKVAYLEATTTQTAETPQAIARREAQIVAAESRIRLHQDADPDGYAAATDRLSVLIDPILEVHRKRRRASNTPPQVLEYEASRNMSVELSLRRIRLVTPRPHLGRVLH